MRDPLTPAEKLSIQYMTHEQRQELFKRSATYRTQLRLDTDRLVGRTR